MRIGNHFGCGARNASVPLGSVEGIRGISPLSFDHGELTHSRETA